MFYLKHSKHPHTSIRLYYLYRKASDSSVL
nr:MAG TPA: hypothetical protein [Caudoviricetes sp.]DAG51130.1 MAG TPA: hypothetical protein [Caudoviricetes sp.]DAO36943.1 MAG TPA: hypothetical protein [Caudoviricetes sp.]